MNVIECGIESKNTRRNPFSIRFFLFIILFIIFDMEILLILHFPFSFKERSSNKLVIINQFFFFLLIFILFVGRLIEKSQGALHWQDYFLR
jgi:NADH:ubiquinone oxidoreductase subunit 3 (subunit A)